MNFLLYPFRILYKIYFASYFIVSLVCFFPFFKFFLSKKERFPTAFKLIRIYAKLWLFFSGIFMKVKGKENIIKNQAFIICSNHSSFIDPACLYSLFDEYFVFTGKQEIEKWPLFHIFYTSGMNILVDRNNRQGILKGFKRMMEVVEKGYPIAIFPEGTVSKEAPKLTDFKTGAVSLAIKNQIPIQAITFTSNWKRLQRKGMFKGKAGPGISTVIIHPAISTLGKTKDDTDSLLAKLRSTINEPLNELYGV